MLTIAGILVKVIGAVSRIAVTRMLGGEGIGLYQMAYPIYLLCLSVSTAGLPIAISIIVAEKLAKQDYRGAHRVFRVSLYLLGATGALFSLALYFGSDFLIAFDLIRDERALYALKALAPAIFFVTLLSSYRGYFQGRQIMMPTAVSQIFEQIIRVITMITLVYWLLPYGIEYGAAGATFGAAPGAAVALLVLLTYYFRQRSGYKHQIAVQTGKMDQESIVEILKRLVKLSIPVSMASIILPLVDFLDLAVVPKRLEVAGFTIEQATELYGYLTGMAYTLINLPTILTQSLAVSLVPAISAAYTLRQYDVIRNRAAMAMRMTLLFCLPSFVGLWLLAKPISVMLFNAPDAWLPIAIMALGLVFLGVNQTTTGVLQGLGKTSIPFRSLIISAIVKFALAWHLTAIWGIAGAAWASVADFFVAAALNLYSVGRLIGFTIDLKETLKTIVAVIFMGVTVQITYHYAMLAHLKNTPSTAIAIVAAMAVYVLVLFFVKGITERDVLLVPRIGPQLAVRLKKIGLLR